MRLRRGKKAYRIPAYGELIFVCVAGNQKHNQMVSRVLQPINPEQMHHMMNRYVEDLLGFPVYFCAIQRELHFWPVPDKPYEVKVRYIPPIAEF